MQDADRFRHYTFRGALFGASAWAAYAVTEFVFTSVVFRLTRPYAEFTTWHWGLNALVAGGYLAVGLVLGALTGLILWAMRRSRHDEAGPELTGLAGSIVLTLALLVNMATG